MCDNEELIRRDFDGLEERICNIEACLDTLFNKLLKKYPKDVDVNNAWTILGLLEA